METHKMQVTRARSRRYDACTQIATPPGRKYQEPQKPNQTKPPTSRQIGWEVRGGQNYFLLIGSHEGSVMLKMILTGWNGSSWEMCLPTTGNSDISYTCGKVWGFWRGKNGSDLWKDGRRIPWGVPQGLDQGEWDPRSVFWEEEHNDTPEFSENSFGSTEHYAVARGGLHPFLGTLETSGLVQVERVGESERGVT